MPELRVYLTVLVREILQWVTEVLVRCGDNETVREVVAQWVTGSAAPFMKKIVRGQDQSQPLMQQILRGVYGEDWRREVRREWRKMSGGSAREIWEEIELVGDILGKSGRDRRERFFNSILEAVLDQLLWDFEYETLVEARGLDWSRVVRKSELLMKAARSGRAVGGGGRVASSGEGAGGGRERGGVGGGVASCPTCNFCQKRTHTDALCVLNPGSQNFKKDLVCQTCGVRGHSSKVCNEAIRAAVKNTGNKPFPNYSVEIAEMLGEEVEDMRIRLPLVVNDLCAEVMYDMGATHSHCDEAWARKYGVRCIRFPSHPPFPHSSYQVILRFKGFLLVVLVPWYGTGKVR